MQLFIKPSHECCFWKVRLCEVRVLHSFRNRICCIMTLFILSCGNSMVNCNSARFDALCGG